ncbi:MAG: hypothetical protein F2894_02210 [Actinobacteria bacterium]|nr:hypothetical protein [Actinomycetota bacterium]MSX81405.1 hypothetical protein [Actinomycetota bacterium]
MRGLFAHIEGAGFSCNTSFVIFCNIFRNIFCNIFCNIFWGCSGEGS